MRPDGLASRSVWPLKRSRVKLLEYALRPDANASDRTVLWHRGRPPLSSLMRLLLDTLYRLCAASAAGFLLAILLLILAQTIGRQIDLVVPSTNEMAGLCMAAATFLALAPTLRAGGHIRVSLVIGRLGPGTRRWAELWCHLFALFIVGYFAWYAGDLAWASLQRGRVTPGLIPIPLWPPQAGVAFGLVMLGVALTEALVDVLRGRPPTGARPAAAVAPPPSDRMD